MLSQEDRKKLKESLNSDFWDEVWLSGNGWEMLTDWTFTSTFPLQSLIDEGLKLMRHYSQRYNRFTIQFCSKKGRTYLWGKLEEDYMI